MKTYYSIYYPTDNESDDYSPEEVRYLKENEINNTLKELRDVLLTNDRVSECVRFLVQLWRGVPFILIFMGRVYRCQTIFVSLPKKSYI